VLAQLGNRVQHALRAFTARDQKAVRAAAETFRANPQLDTATVITELGKGEALVSFLEGNGVPSMVERALIRPPSGRIGPVTAEERKAIMAKSPVRGKYDETADPESAYEVLQKRVQEHTAQEEGGATPAGGQQQAPAPAGGGWGDVLGGIFGGGSSPAKRGGRMSTGEVIMRQVARTASSQITGQITRAILRGVLGSLGRR
jgi:hypothetical protein